VAACHPRDAPPALASSSHPKERTWYQNDALYFTWTNEQADSNFTGYDYVLDRFADTLPRPPRRTSPPRGRCCSRTPAGHLGDAPAQP
jgi:hypothetical protein